MSRDCQHGQLRRSCALCEKDEVIADLRVNIQRARTIAMEQRIRADNLQSMVFHPNLIELIAAAGEGERAAAKARILRDMHLDEIRQTLRARHERDRLRDLIEWFAGSDTGLSSVTLACFMAGATPPRPFSPLDDGDMARCVRLLERFPEWYERLDELAAQYPDWARWVDRIRSALPREASADA